MTRKITMTGKNATYIEHRQAGSDSDEKREIIINGDVTVVEDDSNGKITPEKYIEQLKKSRRSLEYIRRNIDDAIYNMERRLETGYEVCEDTSRQVTFICKTFISNNQRRKSSRKCTRSL